MCQKRRLRKDRGSRDGIKWEIAEAAGSVILGGLRSWQNYPPRRTTVSAHIRFWFPEKALTSYGYMVLPQTNTVTDPYISTGVCVCVCVRTCTPLREMKPCCYWWGWGLKLGSGSHGHRRTRAHTDYTRCQRPSLSGLLAAAVMENSFSLRGILLKRHNRDFTLSLHLLVLVSGDVSVCAHKFTIKNIKM